MFKKKLKAAKAAATEILMIYYTLKHSFVIGQAELQEPVQFFSFGLIKHPKAIDFS